MNFSLVIPLYNESENVDRLAKKVPDALDKNSYINDYEIICIDDCSTDDTYNRLKAILNPKFKVYRLLEKGGQSAAIGAGIKKSKYELIGLIDADLQTSPYDFEKLAVELKNGYDCVVGCRRKRNDNLSKRLSTSVARKIRQKVLKDTFYDISAPLKIFKSKCVMNLTFYDTFHRYLPVMIQMQGYSVIEMDINHFPRMAGESKYGIKKQIVGRH